MAETEVSPAVAPRSEGGSTLKGGQAVLCVLGPEQVGGIRLDCVRLRIRLGIFSALDLTSSRGQRLPR